MLWHFYHTMMAYLPHSEGKFRHSNELRAFQGSVSGGADLCSWDTAEGVMRPLTRLPGPERKTLERRIGTAPRQHFDGPDGKEWRV